MLLPLLMVVVSGCIPLPRPTKISPPALPSLTGQSGPIASLPKSPAPGTGSLGQLPGDGAPGSDTTGVPPATSGSGDRSDHGVLLVHGLGMSGIGMTAIQAYLAAQGVPNVETIDLPGAGISSTMEEMARAVEAQVQAMAARGITRVDLVGHSMGGLVIREYVRARGSSTVAVPTLVTVATPNHGNGTIASALEMIGMKSAISQMAANSDFIARVNASGLPAGTRGYGLWTRHDDIVRPAESCLLPGGENFELDVGQLGAHVAMAIHPTALEAIHRLLVGGGAAQGSV
jgi:triacylglycerol esterase/lipase EstA (alpha/beta hydrolase family)